jgi:nucleotide-binding universal stress UspA family protein
MIEPKRFHRALIPLDGSATAAAILPAFLDLALSVKLEVVLLQVLARVTPPATEGMGRRIAVNPMEQLQQEAEAYLGHVADDLRTRGLAVQTAVRVGDAPTEIVRGARECQADLIAMTTHGRSGLSRLFFGSVAEAVLRRASVPVFLMRITEAEAARQAA